MSRLVRWNKPDASGSAYGTAESGNYRYGSLSWEHVKKLMWYDHNDKSQYPTKEFRARDFKEAKMKAEKWEAKQQKQRAALAGELVKIARELTAGRDASELEGKREEAVARKIFKKVEDAVDKVANRRSTEFRNSSELWEVIFDAVQDELRKTYRNLDDWMYADDKNDTFIQDVAYEILPKLEEDYGLEDGGYY